MPIYQFQNPKTQEIKEISFGMNEEKVHIDENNTEWKRIFQPIYLPSNTHKSLRPSDELKGGGVRYITDDMARAQGLKNADEYIDAHNEVQAEHSKKLPKTQKKIIK